SRAASTPRVCREWSSPASWNGRILGHPIERRHNLQGTTPETAMRDAAGAYADFHRRSLEQPDAFWREQAALVDWAVPFETVCDASRPPFVRWFVGGKTNLCHNAVDRHLATRAGQQALIYVSTETDQERVYSFAELHAEVQRMAAVLLALGVGTGD